MNVIIFADLLLIIWSLLSVESFSEAELLLEAVCVCS